MKKVFKVFSYLIVACLVGVTVSYAGSLTPPGAVSKTMYTLTNIFDLSSGTTSTLRSGTIETTPSVSQTGKTLTEVYTAISGEIAKLSNAKIAKNQTAFGFTGTLYGDTDPAKVLTTATYAGTAMAGRLPKTNQTICYDAAGATITCTDGGTALGGQDGYYQKGIALSYVDNLNGTISDNDTGLMWKKCSEGKTYDVGTGTCTGAYATKTWTNALSACEADATGGHTDWRLPNIRELLSIVDYGRVTPAVNPLFDSLWDTFWSSTTYQDPGFQDSAWYVGFYGGTSYIAGKTASYDVRCIR